MSQARNQAGFKLQTFDALRSSNFRLFWLAMATSAAGQTIGRGAQSWLVLQLTNSSFILGLVGFVSMVPMLALALLAGVISDRTQKRNILLLTHLGFGCTVALLAVLTLLKLVAMWNILILALLMGVSSAFWFPTRQASVPELLPRERVMNGIALNSSGFYVANSLAAGSLGWLLAQAGIHGSFFVAAAIFTLSWVALRLAHWTSGTTSEIARRDVWGDLASAFSHLRRQKVVFALLGITAVGSIFHSAIGVLVPVFARDILQVGEKGFGYLMAASTLGSLVGAIALASMGDYKAKGLIILLTLLVQGISQAVFALSTSFYLSLVAQVFNGVSSAMHISVLVTVIQLASPNELRGRIMGLYFLVFMGISPIGSLYSGTLAEWTTAPFATASGGVVLAALAVGVLLALPSVRKLG